MKRHGILTAIITLCLILAMTDSYAQPKKSNWHEKMMCEKIAFLTSELSLSPEEAQKFWPVYNKISNEILESQKLIKRAYKALGDGIANGASEEELNRLTDAYVKAKQTSCCKCNDHLEVFRSILSEEKVAKLYIAEEQFRRQHIHNMKNQQSLKREQQR